MQDTKTEMMVVRDMQKDRENYDLFLKIVVKRLSKKLSESLCGPVRVSVRRQLRNNGIYKTGLLLEQDNRRISPVIYVDELYDVWINGGTMEGICRHLASCFRKSADVKIPQLESIDRYEHMKERLRIRLVDRMSNLKRMDDFICKPYLDLLVFVCVELCVDDESGVILLTEKQMKKWNVTREQLWRDAVSYSAVNEPWQIMTMQSILGDIGDADDADDTRMFVLTNKSRSYGASVVLYPDVLPWIYDTIGGEFVLLPSSVHEWIVIPWQPDISVERLTAMICEVNRTEVEAEEILSDHPYMYCASERELCMPKPDWDSLSV